MGTLHQKIDDLLHYALKLNASDIHFRVGNPPAFRKNGRLANVKMPPFTTEMMREVIAYLLPNEMARQKFESTYELDGSIDFQGKCRFRFNLFKVDGSVGAVMRLVPLKIPTLEELQFSNVVKQMTELQRALVLITGTTGAGKSTTLAAMVNHLNANFPIHIITIEDPIEFIHKPLRARVTQREVGRDTGSFSEALRAALRQDPDVILVGEMRDAESIQMAIKAAETGHTVLSTIHTTDAHKTISRLISMFPSDEQHEVRYRLANCLKATLSQRLLPRADGQGLVCAQEIMLSNTAIVECIE
ncbi:MAG: PilT/PilU family type 4a pilus ATPase, partial [Bdellovibrionota bacterium]